MGTKVDGSYESLIQGVSQQSPTDRLDGQHEQQINMSNDPEKGLLRRPPTSLVATLGTPGTLYKQFELEGSKYLMVTNKSTSTVKVFNADTGAEIPLTIDNSLSYIAGADSLSCITVDDQVFVSNPSVITQMINSVYPYPNNAMGIATALGASYGRGYNLSVSTATLPIATADVQLPNGTVTHHVYYINMSVVIRALMTNDYNANEFVVLHPFPNHANQGYYSRVLSDESVLIWTGTIEALDLRFTNALSSSDTVALIHKGVCKRTGLLSRLGKGDFCVKIAGAANTEADDYWLKFVRNDGSTDFTLGEGVWEESVDPSVKYQIDSSTMPRRLILNSNGSMTIERVSWKDRRVGDDLTNPIPSFIGYGINDISLFQGRLVFLAGPNVVLSRSHKYTDFWKNSATTLADDDVIDISSATTESTPIMRKAVPHARDLVVFTDTAQFILFGRTTALTPRTASLVLTTTYEANLDADPVAAGKNIFYAIDYGNNTGVKEFYTETEVDINNSRPITSHCTQYLKGRVKHMATTTNFDMLLVQTTESNKDIYLYESIWINDEKRQSAWSTWRFQHEIKYFYFDNDEIILVDVDDLNRTHLLRMQLDRPDDGVGFQVHLDHRVTVSGVGTSFTIPVSVQGMQDIAFIQGVGCPEPGLDVPVDYITGNSVVLQRTMGSGTVIVGTRFNSSTTFTRPVMRDNDGKAVITGTLSVHHFECVLHDSGYIKAVITTPYDDDLEYDNTMWRVDAAQNTLDTVAIQSMTWVIPYMHDVADANLTLQTDTHTPMRITQISWKGDLIKKGTHI